MNLGFSQQVQFIRGFQKASDVADFLLEHPEAHGLAFLGRSNVGKSTLINALFGSSVARTSKTPGRTQQINIFETTIRDFDLKEDVQPLFLFDLPGYGHAKVAKSMMKNWRSLMDSFFATLPASTHLVQIQDARHPHQEADERFRQYISRLPYGSSLVLNKMDKLKTQKERAGLKKKIAALSKSYAHVPFLHFVSAEKKQGIDELKANLINQLLN
jgi:GTP-binding protein